MSSDQKPILIGIEQLAHLLGIGKTLAGELRSQGKLPLPVKLGRRLLWRRAEIEAWAAAGCPALREWQEINN